MTWHPGAVKHEPAGTTQGVVGILVVCDDCRGRDEWFSEAAAKRGGVEGIQRLLYRRGWTLDQLTQRDRCPRCSAAKVGAA